MNGKEIMLRVTTIPKTFRCAWVEENWFINCYLSQN